MMNRLKEPGLNFNSDTANQYRLYTIEISMNLFDAVKSIQHYSDYIVTFSVEQT